MWWLYLVPILTGGSAWMVFAEKRSRLRKRHALVAACRLNLEEGSSPWAPFMKIKASDGPLTVRIRDRRDDVLITAEIQGPPGFQGVRIFRETYRPRAREIEVGDPDFDDTFFVEGPMRLVCALLDAGTRRLLNSINKKSRLEISGGKIVMELKEWEIPDILPLLVDLGRRLAQPLGTADVARRLAANASDDPEAGVRLQNLLLLARELPGDPVTVEALRKALLDESPQVQLRAAKELGEEGSETLLKLAESPIGDNWSAQAVAALDRELPLERLHTVLTSALGRRQLQTARVCIDVLGRHGDTSAVDRLVRVLEREGGAIAAAAARALGAIGEAKAESPLIAALQRGIPEIQVAAANALARIGSTAAVLPLQELSESSARDSDLGRATRQAIAEIQTRLPGASPGQLSLAGDEAGQLSIAPFEAGRLSLSSDLTGQLPLPSREPG